MEEELEIILRAVDEASDTFASVSDSVNDMAGSFDGVSDSTSTATDGIDGVAESGENAGDSMDGMTAAADAFTATALLDFAQNVADTLWNLADSAGQVQDSMDRASLEAEGFGLSATDMKGVLSDVADETGRAGGQIRESFIKATARGVTDMDAFKSMMEGAGAQAYLLGTDIQTMGNKFSSMAQKDTLMTRALAETGITMDELATAMGMTGATADEVKEKWKELDTNQRAALLGTAASMNEAEDANEHYKNSWQGLQDQIDKAKAKLEVTIGKVLLPVLIPALELAGRILDWFGDTLSAVMDGPLGGFISVIGSVGGAIAIAVPAIAALTAAINFMKLAIIPAIAESWALLAPWLPFIAIGAAIVLVIYEIGKAFGWWTDVSSMIDAIWAGIQRLWSAFINNPDVQAAITVVSGALQTLWSWITQAWQALMDFFGIATGGDFDIVRALIDGIGNAWNMVREPIMAVISIIQTVLGVVWSVATGNMDAITAIQTIWQGLVANMPVILNALFQVFKAIWTSILNFVTSLVRSMVNRIVSFMTSLIGKVRSALMGVVASIRSAIQAWITAAVQKVTQLVNDVVNWFKSLPGKISDALSGVVSAITKPFQNAYDTVKGIVDDISNKVQEGLNYVGQLAGYAGGDNLAAGGDSYSVGSQKIEVETTNRVILDLENVPAHIDTRALIEMLSNTEVLRALTGNKDFQDLDSKVKLEIARRANRARGA